MGWPFGAERAQGTQVCPAPRICYSPHTCHPAHSLWFGGSCWEISYRPPNSAVVLPHMSWVATYSAAFSVFTYCTLKSAEGREEPLHQDECTPPRFRALLAEAIHEASLNLPISSRKNRSW